MLYYLIRPFAQIALRVFFRKIYFTNTHHIPKGKPVILAANHPTAFIEPCVLACGLPQALHFIVRGDIFANPVYRKFLLALKMLPIYRFTDGYKKLKNNFETLDYCYEALKEHKTILILAEGKTIQEKRLRPIQKGTARMAFGTLQKYGEDLDIYIVPVGVNYTHADQFRSEVMIDFGAPIALSDYLDDYRTNDRKAIRDVTSELSDRMEARIVNIKAVEDEELVEQLFILYRNNHLAPLLPLFSGDVKRLEEEQAIADYVNDLSEAPKASLKKAGINYFSRLKKYGLDDFGVQNTTYHSFSSWLILLIGFIPFVLGYVFNYLPAAYAHYIANTRIKQLEFIAPTKLAIGLGGYLAYYLVWLIAAIVIGKWWFWIVCLMLPIWGYVTLLYQEFFKKWKAAKQFKQLDITRQQEVRALREILNFDVSEGYKSE